MSAIAVASAAQSCHSVLHRWTIQPTEDTFRYVKTKKGFPKLLGRGRTAMVYEAQYKIRGKWIPCAVKAFYHSDLFFHVPQLMQEFEQEVTHLQMTQHNRHVAQFLGVILPTQEETVDDDAEFSIVTELVRGSTLFNRHNGTPAADAKSVFSVMLQVVRAVMSLHDNGIRHLDLTPNNMKYVTDDDGDAQRTQLKLFDFGHSRLKSAIASSSLMSSAIRVHTEHGTVGFRAPEILKGGEASSKSDVFSLACVMYFVATGKGPFHGEDYDETEVNELMSNGERPSLAALPDVVAKVIRHCWVPDPRQRPTLPQLHDELFLQLASFAPNTPQLRDGYAFVFNSHLNRIGHLRDEELCKDILGWIGCSDVSITSKEMTAKMFLDMVGEAAHWCAQGKFSVFIFSCHGFDGYIQCGGSAFVSVNEVLAVIAAQCPSEKMKLVLFNKCRREPPEGLPDGQRPFVAGREVDTLTHAVLDNFLVGSSCLVGGQSFESEVEGSYFLATMHSILRSGAAHSLVNLMAQTRHWLSHRGQLSQDVFTLHPPWDNATLPRFAGGGNNGVAAPEHRQPEEEEEEAVSEGPPSTPESRDGTSSTWYNLAASMAPNTKVSVGGNEYTKQDCYCKALECDAGDSDAWYNLGNSIPPNTKVSVGGNEYTKQDCFVQALECGAGDSNAWNNIGISLTPNTTVRVDGTEYMQQECFVKAIKCDACNGNAWHNLGISMTPNTKVRINDTEYTQQDCYCNAVECDGPEQPQAVVEEEEEVVEGPPTASESHDGETRELPNRQTNVVLLGETGKGKSTAANAVVKSLGYAPAPGEGLPFTEGSSSNSETQECKAVTCDDVTAVDPPGLLDSHGVAADATHIEHIVSFLKGPPIDANVSAFIIVLNEQEPRHNNSALQAALKLFSDSFGVEMWSRVGFLFTRAYGQKSREDARRTVMEITIKLREHGVAVPDQIPCWQVDLHPEQRAAAMFGAPQDVIDSVIQRARDATAEQLSGLVAWARLQTAMDVAAATAAEYETQRQIREERERAAAAAAQVATLEEEQRQAAAREVELQSKIEHAHALRIQAEQEAVVAGKKDSFFSFSKGWKIGGKRIW